MAIRRVPRTTTTTTTTTRSKVQYQEVLVAGGLPLLPSSLCASLRRRRPPPPPPPLLLLLQVLLLILLLLPTLTRSFSIHQQRITTTTTTTTTMPSRKRGTNKNNNNKNNKNGAQSAAATVVGPDSMQVLKGNLFGKQIAIILCGETHEDAIDVTRKRGIFEPKEDWIELNKTEILYEFNNNKKQDLMARIFATSGRRSLSIGNAKEWAKKTLLDLDIMGQVVLLWVVGQDDNNNHQTARVSKGKAYIVGFSSRESLDDDDDDEMDEWISPYYNDDDNDDDNDDKANNSRILPDPVREWMLHDDDDYDNDKKSSSLSSLSSSFQQKFRSFEWGDLDSQAFELNRRRLTDEEELDMDEYDNIIEQRKARLKKEENIWTWDDWFDHVRTSSTKSCIDTELIIEQSIPPWELELHRPRATDDPETYHLPPAADYLRCMPEDEEGDIEDEYDPASDGVGYYLHFVYRRFMEEMLKESSSSRTPDSNNKNNGDDTPKSTWLHCVDVRDLGCQGACHSPSVEGMWNRLLTKEEQNQLSLVNDIDDDNENNEESTKERSPFISLEPDASNEYIKFVPENRMNPERVELEKLRASGLLTEEYEDDELEEEEDDDDDLLDDIEDFTFPSFEGFFGQNTDFLYYSPHVKLFYSPFLAKCVKSLDNWERFFTDLFLGGTIPDALALLDLDSNDDNTKQHLYVRSAIEKVVRNDDDDKKSSFAFMERDDGENYITYPFFPFIFYLYAKQQQQEEEESSSLQLPPPQKRTFSSQLFSQVCDRRGDDEPGRIAQIARTWSLTKVKECATDPKGKDDPKCGGEWFMAYLYACHRDIYDDIDCSDAGILLQRKNMKSLTSGKKYNIGRIQIPSCQDGFDEIVDCFEKTTGDDDDNDDDDDQQQQQVVDITARVEVMANILIDIWMSCLVDFTTILRILEIASRPDRKNDNIVIVVYMGSAHTRALSDFCVKLEGLFKKKSFVGKTVWEEGEPRTLKLPKYLWNIEELFS